MIFNCNFSGTQTFITFISRYRKRNCDIYNSQINDFLKVHRTEQKQFVLYDYEKCYFMIVLLCITATVLDFR